MLVNISDKLKGRIQRQIFKLLDTECRQTLGKTSLDYMQTGIEAGPEINTVLDKCFWGEHLPLKTQIPRDWCHNITGEVTLYDTNCAHNINIDQTIRFGREWGDNVKVVNTVYTPESLAFRIKLKSPYLAPPNCSAYRPSIAVDRNSDEEVGALFAKAAECVRICNKWNGVRDKVLKFLGSVKSLNEAVKLWPELRSFLEPEDAARLDQKAIRQKREQRESNAKSVLSEIDTQSIVADVVGITLSAA